MIQEHEVSVVADRHLVTGWGNYSISVDMLSPANAFSLQVRFAREIWDLLRRDQEVTVYVDQVAMLTGYIDDRQKVPGDGTTIQISGRDKTGRLVDESSPQFRFGGLGVKELAEKICGITDDDDPLFERVVLVNTRNRSLLRDVRRPQARVVREPLVNVVAGAFRPVARPFGFEIPQVRGGPTVTRRIERPLKIDPGIFGGRGAPKKVQAGAARWAVLEQFLSEARLIAWSSGDGRELFVGMPNYEQETQYRFFEASDDSARQDETNCAIWVTESNAERYSRITCVGSSAGSDVDFGSAVTRHQATVFDNPLETTNGTGRTFLRRKALLIADDSIKSARDALERAEREQLERDVAELVVEVEAPGHGQRYRDQAPTLFTVDTMAYVEDEDTGTRGDFLVTSCEYTGGPRERSMTRLSLVPRGTLLTL